MKEELDFEFVVNKDFRGLKAGTEYSFGKLTFVLDENGNGKSSLLKGILASSNRNNQSINNDTPKGVVDFKHPTFSDIFPIGYFGQDSNLKTLGYLDDSDLAASIGALKSSSGEGTFNQVIDVIKNNYIIVLDEPSTSLSIKNIRKLVYIIKEVIKNSPKLLIITEHNETFLNSFKEEKAYRVNGEEITVETFLNEQFEEEINLV